MLVICRLTRQTMGSCHFGVQFRFHSALLVSSCLTGILHPHSFRENFFLTGLGYFWLVISFFGIDMSADDRRKQKGKMMYKLAFSEGQRTDGFISKIDGFVLECQRPTNFYILCSLFLSYSNFQSREQ